MEQTHSISVAQICEAVGRPAIASALGVRLTAVSNAAVSNTFPARWYLAVKALCDSVGQECPEHLFSFHPAPPEADGSGSQEKS